MHFLTDFADQAVILPLAVAVAMLLALSGWWRGALAWAVTVGATLAAIGAGKLVLAACGPLQLGEALASPSGHTGSGTIVYGGLVALALRRWHPGQRAWPIAAAALIAVVIGTTRVALQTHTLPEVIVGGIAGCAGVAALMALAGDPPPRLRLVRLAAVVAFVAILTHGLHLRAEANIQEFGRRFAWLVPGCAADQARP